MTDQFDAEQGSPSSAMKPTVPLLRRSVVCLLSEIARPLSLRRELSSTKEKAVTEYQSTHDNLRRRSARFCCVLWALTRMDAKERSADGSSRTTGGALKDQCVTTYRGGSTFSANGVVGLIAEKTLDDVVAQLSQVCASRGRRIRFQAAQSRLCVRYRCGKYSRLAGHSGGDAGKTREPTRTPQSSLRFPAAVTSSGSSLASKQARSKVLQREIWTAEESRWIKSERPPHKS